jgi:cytohesin
MRQADQELFKAVERGDRPAAEHALTAGADPNARDPQGKTPLYYAVMKWGRGLIELLEQHGADMGLVELWTHRNDRLMEAAENGAVADAFIALQAGADVNCWDKDGRTPLHIAALHGHSHIVRFLFKRGAIIFSLDRDGNPVHMLDNFRRTALHYAAACISDADLINELIFASGEGVDIPDCELRTPLHYAAEAGNLAAVQMLVRRCATVKAMDEKRLTPTDLAARNCHRKVAKLLRKTGERRS